MALHEKKLDFKSHIVMIRKGEQYQPWFLQINPRGEVPVLKDGVKIIPDSSRIIEYLEDNFSNGGSRRLVPLDMGPEVRQKVMHFRTILDQLPTGIITVGSFYHPELCHNPKPPFIKPVRKLMMAADENSCQKLKECAEKNPEHKAVLLQKAEFQEQKHKIVTSKEEYVKVLNTVDSVLTEVETELGSHDQEKSDWWLCCEQFTVADISLAALLERLKCLGLEHRFWIPHRPHLGKYFSRVQQRDSYMASVPSGLSHLGEVAKMGYSLPLVMGSVAIAMVAISILLYVQRRR
ncbi:ganglioside-induced differentiation-associated protein 1 isoform X2 [Ischnura elegans]|nr:ganglioside-induced differentiation-associated protein 1 isoform X2 [Ischnura elegans]XP_046397160.1 ganglioside-induced differentiation-associated protein 1 isoform X2 [Ischnura elegans]